MKLTDKQSDLFQQVNVILKTARREVILKTTLLEMYKKNWWVTSRFGTQLTFVKEKAYEKDGFSCMVYRITTNINLNELDEETQKIAISQYKKYKHRLQPKKHKELYNEEKFQHSNLPY